MNTFLRKSFFFALCLSWLTVFSSTEANCAQINNIRLGTPNGSQARIVVDLSHQTEYNAFALENPARLVIDLKKTQAKNAEKFLKNPPNYLKNARIAPKSPDGVRIVLELNKAAKVKKSFMLSPQSGFEWRLVIDAVFQDLADAVSIKTAAADDIGNLILQNSGFSGGKDDKSDDDKENKPSFPAVQTPPSAQKPLIVLDAGHGGRDPGAIGKYYKTKEKDITLAIVKQLRNLLVKTGRFRVRLTRESDVAISLWGRRKFAHDIKADLFISIHADSSAKNSQARGLSIYTLSEKASDKEAEKLAERENKADIIAGLDLSAETQEVTDILIDLARRETNNHSSFFAERFVKELSQEVKVLPNAHRFAGFAVLKSPDVPSVLIETGYLSNREEERLLRQESYREKLAKATLRAINKYFNEKHKANFN